LPPRAYCQRGEKHQQHFVDEIAAVKNHRGRNGGKNGSPPDGVTAQTVGEQEQQKNQRRAERDRREPQRGFVEFDPNCAGHSARETAARRNEVSDRGVRSGRSGSGLVATIR